MILQDDIYCNISVVPCGCICVEFHLSSYNTSVKILSKVIFKSSTANNIVKLINSHLLVCSKLSAGHSLYIGGELVKAELALIMSQDYVQN